MRVLAEVYRSDSDNGSANLLNNTCKGCAVSDLVRRGGDSLAADPALSVGRGGAS